VVGARGRAAWLTWSSVPGVRRPRHARINQLRKYTRQPYDVHLKVVADLVAAAGGDAAMIAAAWLHDTVEDTPATFEEIEREFGADVAALVKELTDVSRPGEGNRAARKAVDRAHTAAASRARRRSSWPTSRTLRGHLPHDPKVRPRLPGRGEGAPRGAGGWRGSLYAKADGLVSAWEARLAPAAESLPQEPGSGPPGGGPARAGRHGIRLFMEAFAARDILEPLISFDDATVGSLAPGAWPWPDVAVVGVRRTGGRRGACCETTSRPGYVQVREIDRQQRVALDAPLTEVIHVLTHFTRCFVELDGVVVGSVGRGDIGSRWCGCGSSA